MPRDSSSGADDVRVRSSLDASDEVAVPVRRSAVATATIDAPTVAPEVEQPERVGRPARPRTAAAERAYARRAHREGRRPASRAAVDPEEAAAGRASFVVLIIALLAVGVAATLWLTTQAVADSYRLENAKKEANQLAEQAAQLQREVTRKESASALAERARQLGMVPAGDPARLVVGPDGTVTVVGDAKPVRAPAPPAPDPAAAGTQPVDPAAGAQAAAGTQTPVGAVPAGTQAPGGAVPADGQAPVGAQPPAGGTGTAPPAGGGQPPAAAGTQPPAGGAPPAQGAAPPPGGGG
ncbi:hypothetical protein [Alloactinosynnema sp. L-07]|uniref:hypothetical protein n=1 Tax=Alloactinosynnema sp. L-07 TaxID=1653480 RepID=UPI0006B63F14|nr:hypothetical protein [Alloactinosynnema sp. L-07]